MVLVAGAALFATSFVPLWATYRVPGLGVVAPQTDHVNAWDAYGLKMGVALVFALAATIMAAFAAIGPAVRSPVRAGIVLGLSGTATLLLVWEVVTGPFGTSNPNGYGIERGVLLFTGVALAGAMTYGSYLMCRETGWEGPLRG